MKVLNDTVTEESWETIFDSNDSDTLEEEKKKPKDKEMVNHPSHYNKGSIEVIDFIEDQDLGFHEGNTVKYVCRAKHKGKEIEDLKKALWYLQRKIDQLSRKT